MTTAPPTLYFENNAGQLLLDPAGFLRANWSARPRGPEDAKGLLTHMAAALQRHGWSRVLIDQRHMPPFTPAEQQWITQQWLPQTVRASGYRHGAVVVSPQVLVRLATAFVTTHVQGLPLVYRSFEDEAEARQWLLRQPGAPA